MFDCRINISTKIRLFSSLLTLSSFLLGLITAFPTLSSAQTSLETLDMQIKRFELEKAKIEAENAAFKANFPTSTIKPLDGGFTINPNLGTSLPIETEILVYQALEQILPKLVKKISSSGINLNSSHIVIDDGTIISKSLESYNNYRSQASYFRETCNQQLNLALPPLPKPGSRSVGNPAALVGPGAILDAPSSVLGAIANITSFFKTTAEFGGKEVTIKNPAYVAKLASLLKEQNVSIYLPEFSSLNDGMTYILDDVRILGFCLQKAKAINAVDISVPLTSFLSKIFDLPDFTLATPPAIMFISKGASVQAILNKPKSYILYMGTISGGTNRITNNLFTGPKLRHSGGIIHYYSLIDNSGAIKFSDFDYLYTGFRKLPVSEDMK